MSAHLPLYHVHMIIQPAPPSPRPHFFSPCVCVCVLGEPGDEASKKAVTMETGTTQFSLSESMLLVAMVLNQS